MGKSPGRPKISNEVKEVIKRIYLDNKRIGGLRIWMILKHLGFAVSLSSIYRQLRLLKQKFPDLPSQNWKTFLRNSKIIAMDFTTVFIEVSKDIFKEIFIFSIIDHDRRKIIHCNLTQNPTQEWVIQQLKNCFGYSSFDAGENHRRNHLDHILNSEINGRSAFPHPGKKHNYKYMVHDRDSCFMHKVQFALANYFQIEPKPTSPKSPWQNPFIESFHATLKRELLNHVVLEDEFHLRKLLKEYIHYYNHFRMHSGLMDSPEGLRHFKDPPKKNAAKKIKSISFLNGLEHYYYWQDAA